MEHNFSKDIKLLNKKSFSRENSVSNINRKKQNKEKINLNEIFLYSWGKNKNGELGIGKSVNANIPTPITSLDTKNIISVVPGGRNTLLIREDGNIYLCGSNIFGLLAHNSDIQDNTLNQKNFEKIDFFEENGKKIKSISTAEFHCLALDTEGYVYGWGGNLFNKLGKRKNLKNNFETEIKYGAPKMIDIKVKISSISCGDYHSCALSESGVLYSWGGGGESYNKGQCGHGNLKDYDKPEKVDFFVKNKIKIKKVSCGGYHTIVISENNEYVFSFGKGIFGQLGYGIPENTSVPKKVIFESKQNLKYEKNEKINIVDIKCGGEHSLFLSSNNNVYACGHGYLGQLGFGNDKNINKPLIVKSLTNKKIIEIAAGWSHSMVLSSEGNIYSTGCNKYGELGTGKNNNKYNYTWVSKLSKLNIKHISAGGHHSWCLLDNSEPYRKNKNIPEPLLKSNFSMKRKIERKLSNLSQDLDDSRWDRKSTLQNKKAISVDNTLKRRYRDSEEDDEISYSNFIEKNKKKPNRKIRKIIDDYNNKNNMSVDDLINGIDNINKNSDNSDSENNNKENIINLDEKEKEILIKMEEDFTNCELKIIYTDLNLSHRFIRFQSSTDYEQLKEIIINNFIKIDDGIISYQFQRDDEVENNYSTISDFAKVYNTIKINNLYKFDDDLSKTYTLGIVYDYKKNMDSIKYDILYNNKKKINKGPFCGFKIVNSKEILENKNNIENQLSQWIIQFYKIYNMILLGERDKTIKRSKCLFLDLRPNYLNPSNI